MTGNDTAKALAVPAFETLCAGLRRPVALSGDPAGRGAVAALGTGEIRRFRGRSRSFRPSCSSAASFSTGRWVGGGSPACGAGCGAAGFAASRPVDAARLAGRLRRIARWRCA